MGTHRGASKLNVSPSRCGKVYILLDKCDQLQNPAELTVVSFMIYLYANSSTIRKLKGQSYANIP
jgi:hypothetical protein